MGFSIRIQHILAALVAMSVAGAAQPVATELSASGTEEAVSFKDLKRTAERFDRDEDWPAAIATYLTIVEAFGDGPQSAFAGGQIELLATMFLEGDVLLDEGQFAAMEPALADAANRNIFPAAMLLAVKLRETGRSEEAFQWLQRAAAKGYPPAMVQVGLMYSNGDGVRRNMEKASSWLRPANVKGSAVGKYLLAECFLYGKGVPRNPDVAVSLLRDASRMENPGRALDLLATCYHKGWGVAADHAEAARLYKDACDHGFYNAYANLGVLYMKGEGVARSSARAVKLFKDGVAEGNGLCMYFYAAAHLDGLGVPRDEKKAREWFRKAAKAGNPQALAWCRANGEPGAGTGK